jgi:hypothetical protein
MSIASINSWGERGPELNGKYVKLTQKAQCMGKLKGKSKSGQRGHRLVKAVQGNRHHGVYPQGLLVQTSKRIPQIRCLNT